MDSDTQRVYKSNEVDEIAQTLSNPLLYAQSHSGQHTVVTLTALSYDTLWRLRRQHVQTMSYTRMILSNEIVKEMKKGIQATLTFVPKGSPRVALLELKDTDPDGLEQQRLELQQHLREKSLVVSAAETQTLPSNVEGNKPTLVCTLWIVKATPTAQSEFPTVVAPSLRYAPSAAAPETVVDNDAPDGGELEGDEDGAGRADGEGKDDAKDDADGSVIAKGPVGLLGRLLASVTRNDDTAIRYIMTMHGVDGGMVHADIDKFSNTLLHAAAENNADCAAQQLLFHGARQDTQNRHRHTPLQIATTAKHQGVLRVLRDFAPQKPIDAVIAAINDKDIDLLKAAVATPVLDIDARPKGGKDSPLVAAVRQGNVEATRLLLEAGACAGINDLQGQPLISIAMKLHHVPTQTALLQLLLAAAPLNAEAIGYVIGCAHGHADQKTLPKDNAKAVARIARSMTMARLIRQNSTASNMSSGSPRLSQGASNAAANMITFMTPKADGSPSGMNNSFRQSALAAAAAAASVSNLQQSQNDGPQQQQGEAVSRSESFTSVKSAHSRSRDKDGVTSPRKPTASIKSNSRTNSGTNTPVGGPSSGAGAHGGAGTTDTNTTVEQPTPALGPQKSFTESHSSATTGTATPTLAMIGTPLVSTDAAPVIIAQWPRRDMQKDQEEKAMVAPVVPPDDQNRSGEQRETLALGMTDHPTSPTSPTIFETSAAEEDENKNGNVQSVTVIQGEDVEDDVVPESEALLEAAFGTVLEEQQEEVDRIQTALCLAHDELAALRLDNAASQRRIEKLEADYNKTKSECEKAHLRLDIFRKAGSDREQVRVATLNTQLQKERVKRSEMSRKHDLQSADYEKRIGKLVARLAELQRRDKSMARIDGSNGKGGNKGHDKNNVPKELVVEYELVSLRRERDHIMALYMSLSDKYRLKGAFNGVSDKWAAWRLATAQAVIASASGIDTRPSAQEKGTVTHHGAPATIQAETQAISAMPPRVKTLFETLGDDDADVIDDGDVKPTHDGHTVGHDVHVPSQGSNENELQSMFGQSRPAVVTPTGDAHHASSSSSSINKNKNTTNAGNPGSAQLIAPQDVPALPVVGGTGFKQTRHWYPREGLPHAPPPHRNNTGHGPPTKGSSSPRKRVSLHRSPRTQPPSATMSPLSNSTGGGMTGPLPRMQALEQADSYLLKLARRMALESMELERLEAQPIPIKGNRRPLPMNEDDLVDSVDGDDDGNAQVTDNGNAGDGGGTLNGDWREPPEFWG